MNAKTARVLARAALGATAAKRYGAPYWVIHRGDLQTVLLESVRAHPGIALELGTRVEDFAPDGGGVTVSARSARAFEQRGSALIAADGLWSSLRRSLGDVTRPAVCTPHGLARPCSRRHRDLPNSGHPRSISGWATMLTSCTIPCEAAALINIVAIVRDEWREPGWSAPGERAEILARYPAGTWAAEARAVLAAPPSNGPNGRSTTARRSRAGARDAVTLLGDAAHPMLPYLAQGAAMAIEDAAVLAQRLADAPGRSGCGHAPLRAAAAATHGAHPARSAPQWRDLSHGRGGRRFCARSRSSPWADSGSSPATIGSMAGSRPDL